MTTFQTAERSRVKRVKAEQAVKHALANQWEDAAAVNQELVGLFPDDVESWNRLGKALSELGQYARAQEAYTNALRVDPNNNIAQKNLKRLALLVREDGVEADEAARLDPDLFIEEMGKTARLALQNPAPPEALARLTAGDQVFLRPEGAKLLMVTARGRHVGEIERRLARRLTELMATGNEYAAAVTGVTDTSVNVIIRETRQDPRNAGRVSFPGKAGPLPPDLRPYTKDRALRYDLEDEEEPTDEEERGEAEGRLEPTTSDIEFYEEETSAD